MNTNLFYGLWENEIVNAIDCRDFAFTIPSTLDSQSNFHFRRKNTLKQNTAVQNPCRDVPWNVSTFQNHTQIQQRPDSCLLPPAE